MVSKAYPLTASRLTGVMAIRDSKLVGFGVPLYPIRQLHVLVDSIVSRVSAALTPKELAVITSVWTAEQYKFLRAAGYTPIHVMCNNITRTGRGGSQVVDSLTTTIERDITNKISSEPRVRSYGQCGATEYFYRLRPG